MLIRIVEFMSLPQETLSLIIHPPAMHEAVLPECQIRSTIDDFVVEEIAAYPLTGSGEHAFLWLEKRGLAAPELVNRIIKTLGVPSKDVGVAGQKDRHAVTRQYCSIPRRLAIDVERLNSSDLQILSVTHHQNKLKTGHLKGNRFRLVLRSKAGFTAEQAEQVAARLQQLEQTGFPNYFGPQRFGHGGNTLTDGLKAIKGKLPKDHWPENQSRTLQRLALSAVQSAVFNLVVAERVAAKTVGTVLPGDVVIRKEGIKPYRIPEGADTTQVVPAGPMPGPEMLAATDTVGAMEQESMLKVGVTDKDFTRFEKLTSGIRRKMLEFPSETSAVWQSDGSIETRFVLSAGTYATTMLQEVTTLLVDAAAAE